MRVGCLSKCDMGLTLDEQNRRQEAVHDIRTFEPQDKVKYVFISYKSDDWDIVLNEIVRTLQKQYGLRVYFDSNFERHDTSWFVNMQNAISTGNCAALISFVSKKYMKSYACMMELLTTYSIATENKHRRKSLPIIPVIIDDSVDLEDAVTYSQEPVEIAEWEFFEELLEDVLGSRSFEENKELGRAVKALQLRGERINEEDVAVACLGLIDDAYVRRYNGQEAFFENLVETLRNISTDVVDSQLIGEEENAEEVIAEDKLSVSEVAALEEEEELPVLEVVAQEAEIDEVEEEEAPFPKSSGFLTQVITDALKDVIKQQGLGTHPRGTAEQLRHWNYRLTDDVVLLKSYIGTEAHVTVYGAYLIEGKEYKTQLASFEKNYREPYMFKADINNPNQKNLQKIKTIHFLEGVNSKQVTNMSLMFEYCTELESVDISCLDTSGVTEMRNLFMGCSSLISLDLSNFDTANVKDMSCMFVNCTSLKELDLSHFRTQNVIHMERMFEGCSSLQRVDISSFETEQVTNMSCMFYGCKSLKTLDLSHFRTQNVKSMQGMFAKCESLEQLDIRRFVRREETKCERMFDKCLCLSEIPQIPMLGELVGSNIEDWDYCLAGDSVILNSFLGQTESVIVYARYWVDGNVYFTKLRDSKGKIATPYMFNAYTNQGCSKIRSICFAKEIDTSNVTDMSYMFEGCISLEELDISGFNTGAVKNMECMFEKCSSLVHLDLSHFDTGKVTNMQAMFFRCIKLESLQVESFDTSKVTNMVRMFAECWALKHLDLSSFHVASVVQIGSMFKGCESLERIVFDEFDTSNVVNMGFMFCDCGYLLSLDLSSFNTGKVQDMQGMFKGCAGLVELDLSSFNTTQVTNMQKMFWGCKGLRKLNIKYFDTSKVTNMTGMFQLCSSLIALIVEKLDMSMVTASKNMFLHCPSVQRYVEDTESC